MNDNESEEVDSIIEEYTERFFGPIEGFFERLEDYRFLFSSRPAAPWPPPWFDLNDSCDELVLGAARLYQRLTSEYEKLSSKEEKAQFREETHEIMRICHCALEMEKHYRECSPDESELPERWWHPDNTIMTIKAIK